MEHAKKYILVDPKFAVAPMTANAIPTLLRPSMADKMLSQLDVEITNALQSDLPDDEKAKKYASAIYKYKIYNATPSEIKPVKQSMESETLETVPSALRHKAKRVYSYLNKNSDVNIADDGQLIYKQQPIQNSNIADLMNDILLKKSASAPPGWREFVEILKNAPRDLITNDARWKHMHGPPAKPTIDEANTPSRKRRRSRKIRAWDEY